MRRIIRAVYREDLNHAGKPFPFIPWYIVGQFCATPGYRCGGVEKKLGWPPQALTVQSAAPNGPGAFLVLSRAAYKLLSQHTGDGDGAIDFVRSLPGVADAGLVDGNWVRQQFMDRPSPNEQTEALSDTSTDLWHLDRIHARQAWALLGSAADSIDWRDIKVAHIDTGIARHPVFGNWTSNIGWVQWHEGINYKDDGLPFDPLGYPGFPGHGTRTASVLAGCAPDAQFWGVAPKVPIIPYRITDTVVIDFFGSQTQLDAALRHAVEHAGVDVVSISLGDPCNASPAVGAAVDAAYQAGVIIVAAAGNVTSEVTYPGRYSRVVTAGGSTTFDTPWQGASRGSKVDLSAPADAIHRANSVKTEAGISHGYSGGGNGTSFATAMIAGAAALWRTYHRDELKQLYPYGWQIVEAFRYCARNSATTPVGWPEKLYGKGILNVEALLQHPLPTAAVLVEEMRSAEKERF